MRRALALRHLLLRRIAEQSRVARSPEDQHVVRRLSEVAEHLHVEPGRGTGYLVSWQLDGDKARQELGPDEFRFYERKGAAVAGGGDSARDSNLAAADRFLSGIVGKLTATAPESVLGTGGNQNYEDLAGVLGALLVATIHFAGGFGSSAVIYSSSVFFLLFFTTRRMPMKLRARTSSRYAANSDRESSTHSSISIRGGNSPRTSSLFRRR